MLNNIVLQGRFVADPEIRATPKGQNVATFTLAVERDTAGADGKKITDFINCAIWNRGAEFVDKWFSKGDMASVAGRLQMKNWTDRNGAKRRDAEVLVQSIYFAGSKGKSEVNAEETESELPF